MAIEQGIWKIGDQPQQLKPAALADEALLEEMVMKDIAIQREPPSLAQH